MNQKSIINKNDISSNYLVIQGWMSQYLDLSLIELIVLAIIFGFSQDGDSKFTGSLKYLTIWTKSSKSSMQRTLKKLLDKNLILKTSREINGLSLPIYSANLIELEKIKNEDNNQNSSPKIIDWTDS